MDANALDMTTKTYLTDVRAKLERGLRIAEAADICAGSRRIRKGMEIALSLEPIVYELDTHNMQGAQLLINQLRAKSVVPP